MTRLFLWLSGVNAEALKQCSSESFKFAALGGTVATTSALAAFSAYAVAHTFLHLSVGLGVLMAIFWGVAIMNLDRWLLATLSRQATRHDTLMIAIPRVFLAVLVGLVVSLVIMLDVFHHEVTKQAVSNVQRAAAADRRARAEDYAQIGVLRAERARLQARLAAPPSPDILTSDNLYPRWVSELKARDAQLLNAERGANAAFGTPIYPKKQEIVRRLRFRDEQTRLAAQKRKVTLLRRASQAKAQQDAYDQRRLVGVTTELNDLQQQRKIDERHAVGVYDSSPSKIGLLDRIEALWTLAVDHAAIMIGLLIGSLIILTIDALPVGAKTLLLLSSDPSLYDRTVGEFEEEKFQTYRSEVAAVAERRRLENQVKHDKLHHDYEGQKIELEAEVAGQRTAHQIAIDKAAAEVQAEKDALKAAAKIRAVRHDSQVSEAEDEASADAKVRVFQYEVVVDHAMVRAKFEKEALVEGARKIVAAQQQVMDKYIEACAEIWKASVDAQIEALKQSAPGDAKADAAAEAARAAGSQASTGGGPSAGP